MSSMLAFKSMYNFVYRGYRLHASSVHAMESLSASANMRSRSARRVSLACCRCAALGPLLSYLHADKMSALWVTFSRTFFLQSYLSQS